MEDLSLLLQSRYPILYVETFDEERLRRRLGRTARSLGFTFYTWSVSGGLACDGGRDEAADAREPLALLGAIRNIGWPSVFLLLDFHPYLESPGVVRALRELAEEAPGKLRTIVLSSPSIDLPLELRRSAARFRMDGPEPDEIRATIIETFRSLRGTRPLRFDLPGVHLDRMVQALRGLTLAEIRRLIARATLSDGALHAEDLPLILAARREEIEQTGVLDLCEVSGEVADLAGADRLKSWLRIHRAGFGAKAKELGLPAPRGLLLVGVQGCGKSLAAKTIARSWGLPLARLDPARLFDKFVGETEKNLRRALETAEEQAPIVLWIDEIEKAFAGGSGDADAGLGRRLLGSFLTWLQDHREPAFVVATANDLDSLPPELLRKGRFNEIFFIDLPTPEERREIFEIHLRLRHQDPSGVDIARLVAESEGWSGAEIEQVVVAALYGVLDDPDERLTTERLSAELRATLPLSRTRAEELEVLRSLARVRFVPAR